MVLTSFCHAFAFHVNASTLVAELKLAFASHVVTSVCLFDPELTLGTLLEFVPLSEVQKLFIIFRHSVGYFVLSAAHVFVPVASAVETVLFFALRALKPGLIAFFEEKHPSAGGSGTP
jgi:hypothetical protein